MQAGQFIDQLIAEGRYCFNAEQALNLFGSAVVATRGALRRLRHKGEMAMPYKGFYVIVPPEYRKSGINWPFLFPENQGKEKRENRKDNTQAFGRRRLLKERLPQHYSSQLL